MQLGYTESMKITLAQLRLQLAVILLIAGGAIAGLAEQASAMGVGVTADVATFSTSALHKVMGHVAFTDQDNHRAPCDGCVDCVHSTGTAVVLPAFPPADATFFMMCRLPSVSWRARHSCQRASTPRRSCNLPRFGTDFARCGPRDC